VIAMRMRHAGILLSCCLLVACGNEESAADKAPVGEDGLPKPASASGSVTGMPNPGVAEPRPVAAPPQDADIAEIPEPLPEEIPPPETGMPPPAPPPPAYDGSPEMVPLPPLEPTPPPPPPPEQ